MHIDGVSPGEGRFCEIHRFCASLELAGLFVVAVWTCTEVREASMRGMHLAVQSFR